LIPSTYDIIRKLKLKTIHSKSGKKWLSEQYNTFAKCSKVHESNGRSLDYKWKLEISGITDEEIQGTWTVCPSASSLSPNWSVWRRHHPLSDQLLARDRPSSYKTPSSPLSSETPRTHLSLRISSCLPCACKRQESVHELVTLNSTHSIKWIMIIAIHVNQWKYSYMGVMGLYRELIFPLYYCVL